MREREREREIVAGVKDSQGREEERGDRRGIPRVF